MSEFQPGRILRRETQTEEIRFHNVDDLALKTKIRTALRCFIDYDGADFLTNHVMKHVELELCSERCEIFGHLLSVSPALHKAIKELGMG